MSDTETMTTAEVAKRLGITRSRVSQLVDRRILTPVERGQQPNGRRGSYLFRRSDVERYAAAPRHRGAHRSSRREEAATQARVFRLFEEGKTLAEIVVAVGIPALEVRRMHNEWRTPLGGSPPRLAEEIEREKEKDHQAFLAAVRRDAEARRAARAAHQAAHLERLRAAGTRPKR